MSMRTKILKIYATILIIGFSYYLWATLTNLTLPCFYYTTTGFLCPGCGITRMFLSMAKLDFSTAFFYNPVAFILFFIWNMIALLCFLGKPVFIKSQTFLYSTLCISVAVLTIWGIVRNLS